MEFICPDDNKISLLYVEDEPNTKELIYRAISQKFPAVEINIAEHGKNGLDLFKKINADIVLTDIDMPVMNGILMAREIRKLNPKAEIIVLSGQEEECYGSDCVNIGIRHYLKKPIRHEVLFGAIGDSIARIDELL
jgi:YesN/AraC family two-component response regulator